MSSSHEFTNPYHFVAGAIGEPGQRVFYVQAAQEQTLVSVKMEKQQVQALAQFLGSVLDDLPASSGEAMAGELIGPVEPLWVVGQIAVGIDEAESRVVLVLEELVIEDDDDELADIEPDFLEDVSTGARLRVHITAAQARAFITQSEALMTQGRPPCRLCGQPEGRDGHVCPRLN
jgi:uncharacterized repeat protein (TIGR03847 family)